MNETARTTRAFTVEYPVALADRCHSQAALARIRLKAFTVNRV